MLLGMCAYAQDIEVPAKVLAAFEAKYPNAEEVEWKLRNDTYQAEYSDFFQTIAVYNLDGQWMKTISLISEDDLPEITYDYIEENYDLSQILQIHMIEDNKQTISYKVIVLDDGTKVTLKFKEDGALFK